MLKVRPHTKSGGGGAVHFRSDIRKVGGGGAVHFRSDIRKVGGGGGGEGQSTSGPIYEKWVQVRYTKSGGGGGQFASGPIRKAEGGRYLCLAQRKYFIS